MNWRNKYWDDKTIYKGGGIAQYALSIVLLAGLFIIITTTSCKQECVDICMEFSLVLDETDCSCVCPEKLAPFTINGYVYCIDESNTQDIYILEDLNISSILIKDGIQTPIPEIMISYIPKQLDTVKSFFEWSENDAPFYIPFELNVLKSTHPDRFYEYGSYFWITKFNNIQSPELILYGVNYHFRDMVGKIDGNLFPTKKHGLGIIQFSENMDQMFFHYFGYDHNHDMFDAFHNLSTEEVFQFPYTPQDTERDPYKPYYTQLTFSRLNLN